MVYFFISNEVCRSVACVIKIAILINCKT